MRDIKIYGIRIQHRLEYQLNDRFKYNMLRKSYGKVDLINMYFSVKRIN